MNLAPSELTARAIAGLIESEMPPRKPDTLDTFKFGNPDTPVRGVATTFMASREVLQKAVDAGANFLITHEPSFYNHRDETDWLERDPVYLAKKDFLESHGLVLWRFHDGWHRMRPDGIQTGEAKLLGWEPFRLEGEERLYRLPEQSVAEMAGLCKKKIGVAQVRVAGDPAMPCRVVGLLPGSPGGRAQIETLMRPEVDVIVCGESAEWETCEYVRDAAAAGQRKALIILGHANSEEAGVAYFADWLRERLPEQIPVTHLVAGDPFRFI
jgi:putative NIF3 family GTP cyclohydrolase 1 type 2